VPVVVIRPGDCVASVAEQAGFADWRRVWEAAENASLRAERSNPNVLVPGDLLWVPEVETKQVALPSGTPNKLRLERGLVDVRIQITDERGGLVGRRFRLTVGGACTEGRVPDSGLVEARAAADVARGELELWLRDAEGIEPVRVPLELGALEPEWTESGARARLDNLGFVGRDLADTVRAFQRTIGLQATGELDEATRGHLRRATEEP
jgi:hypothetical protein